MAQPIVTPIHTHQFTGATLPQILGHEFSAEVVETGKDVTRFRRGDRVSIQPLATGPEDELARVLGWLGSDEMLMFGTDYPHGHDEGVEKVDFLTAGDARVCPTCSALEANNPYPVADAPRPAIHPFCRCTVAAVTPLRRDLVAKYLT